MMGGLPPGLRLGITRIVVAGTALGIAGTLYAASLRICDDVKDPPTLDPVRVFDDKSYNLLQQIFDGLIQFDAQGRLRPGLALSWERLDPLTMRFHLRPGVRFHNGEVFDAEAVRLTLERHLDPARQFPGLGFANTISEARVRDPLTVDIITHVPDSLLLRRLATFFLMLPPKAYDAPGFGANPIGTGAYRFKKWVKGQYVALERNENHWEHKPSAPREVEFHFVPAEKQVSLLLLGDLDMVTDLPGTFTYKVASSHKTKVIKKETYYLVTGHFNTGKGILRDVRVRKAINYAVNKRDLIRYDVLGNGIALAGLSMPGEIGHNSNLRPYEYNPEKAKALLAEAGVVLPITLKVSTKVQGSRAAQVLKENLGKVGVRLDIYRTMTDAETIQNKDSQEMDMGIAGFPDVMGHVYFPQSILLYSKSPFSLHNDPEYDRRLEGLVATLDPEEHEKLAAELDRYVHEQALAIFMYQLIRTYGVSRAIDFAPSVTSRLYCNRIQVPQAAASR
jgi:peptide/nickel transport system substrate-binding protein